MTAANATRVAALRKKFESREARGRETAGLREKDFADALEDSGSMAELAAFHAQTAPVIDYYSKQGKVAKLDANKSFGDVASQIAAALKTDK